MAFYRIREGRDLVLSWELERRCLRTGDSGHWLSDLEGCELPPFPLVLTSRGCQYALTYRYRNLLLRDGSSEIRVDMYVALAVLQKKILISLNLSQSRVLLERRARLYSRCFLGVRVLHSHVIHDWVY